MSDALVLEIMRAIRGDLAELKAEQRAEIGGRCNRILDKIERRLNCSTMQVDTLSLQ